jgi:hypothetical protein
MREREVVKRIAERLRVEGVMILQVRYGQEQGPDIEGILPTCQRHLYIEAKGERPGGQESAKRRVALGEALYQTLAVYDADVVCAIALPFNAGYQRLLQKVLPGIRRLGLHVLLVRDDEIWHLAPTAPGFFPTKPTSLIEALEQ